MVIIDSNNNFSLYIGNDNSPSDPLPIIEKYLDKDSYHFFKYIENLGKDNLVLAWNRILNEVDPQVEWLQVLGDDDKLELNFVDELLRSFTYIDKVNVIKVKSNKIDDKDVLIYDFSKGLATKYYFSVDLFLKKLSGDFNSSLSEHVFRFSYLKEIV